MPKVEYNGYCHDSVGELIEQAFRRAVYRTPASERRIIWQFMPQFFADLELLQAEAWLLAHYGGPDDGQLDG
jgi:hypothetical protein